MSRIEIDFCHGLWSGRGGSKLLALYTSTLYSDRVRQKTLSYSINWNHRVCKTGIIYFIFLTVWTHFTDCGGICCRLVESECFYYVRSRRISLSLFADRFRALSFLARSNIECCDWFDFTSAPCFARVRFSNLNPPLAWSLMLFNRWKMVYRLAVFQKCGDLSYTVRRWFITHTRK